MKNKKLVAPIVITACLVLYFLLFVLIAFITEVSWQFRIIGSLIPLCLIGVSVYVLVERIKEIRSGEEDDLSKY